MRAAPTAVRHDRNAQRPNVDAPDERHNKPHIRYVFSEGGPPKEAPSRAAVSYAISASVGGIVASHDYLVVAPEYRRRGIGSALIDALAEEVGRAEIARLDAAAHIANEAAKQFYLERYASR